MDDSEPLQTLELLNEGCIDTEQPRKTTTSKARSVPTQSDTADSVGATEENQVEEEALDSQTTDHPVQRTVRTRNPPIGEGLAQVTHTSVTVIQEPGGYSETVSGPKKEQWLAAMALEVMSLEAMGTWTLVIDQDLEKYFLDDGSCC